MRLRILIYDFFAIRPKSTLFSVVWMLCNLHEFSWFTHIYPPTHLYTAKSSGHNPHTHNEQGRERENDRSELRMKEREPYSKCLLQTYIKIHMRFYIKSFMIWPGLNAYEKFYFGIIITKINNCAHRCNNS